MSKHDDGDCWPDTCVQCREETDDEQRPGEDDAPVDGDDR
jgi:hypothetical protein